MTQLRAAVACAALLLAACGGGEDTTVAAASNAAPGELAVEVHDGEFARIQTFTTPGGVSVWLVEEPSIPIVAIEASWPGGTSSDPEGLEGLANMVAYQMNEGAGELDALAFQTRMEELNMSFGCDAGRDWLSCSAQMLSENAGEAMDLVALAFAAPRFDEAPFERARREALIGVQRRATQPGFLATDAMEEALFHDHPYARDTSEASINAITRQAAMARQTEMMRRDGLLVTAVGDISPADLAPLVDKAFAGLPESGGIELPEPVELANPPADPIVVALPQPQSLLTFTAPGLQRDDADFFPAYVLNHTLGGGGFESRLMEELRETRGLTYGISTSLDFGGQLALWQGGAQTRNESAGLFLSVLKDELSAFVEDGVTAEELEAAKAYLTGSYALGFDSNAKIAGNLMSVRQQDLGVDYFDRRNALVDAVTLEDVNRVASAFLDPARFTYVFVGQPEGLDAAAD